MLIQKPILQAPFSDPDFQDSLHITDSWRWWEIWPPAHSLGTQRSPEMWDFSQQFQWFTGHVRHCGTLRRCWGNQVSKNFTSITLQPFPRTRAEAVLDFFTDEQLRKWNHQERYFQHANIRWKKLPGFHTFLTYMLFQLNLLEFLTLPWNSWGDAFISEKGEKPTMWIYFPRD